MRRSTSGARRASGHGRVRAPTATLGGKLKDLRQQVCAAAISWARAIWPDSRHRVQPRTRREHFAKVLWMGTMKGSAPHVRGSRSLDAAGGAQGGISPAHAGSTPHTLGSRVCIGTGSAPHVREAHVRHVLQGRQDGISPARAGSTAPSTATPDTGRDQPRTRGEHGAINGDTGHGPGSAPHARGALEVNLPSEPEGDQPRTRGEHALSASKTSLMLGSTPHAPGSTMD